MLDIMTDQNVPATPENYQVWFAYVAQSSPDLTLELNLILRDDTPFSDALNKDISERYFETKEKMAAYDRTSADFRAEMA
jgi:diguanylate cyclase